MWELRAAAIAADQLAAGASLAPAPSLYYSSFCPSYQLPSPLPGRRSAPRQPPVVICTPAVLQSL
ncbi:hypothetical protein E2C01_038041 [Portunus trituberculatus]|uniref:Uncharacterized protein n=1 Tax=Portunus trituberculatus TaxID=210409 RepID=A0A5B7FHG4_PORTR|nr:hypothetical protein [Portunus trituberculatus]